MASKLQRFLEDCEAGRPVGPDPKMEFQPFQFEREEVRACVAFS